MLRVIELFASITPTHACALRTMQTMHVTMPPALCLSTLVPRQTMHVLMPPYFFDHMTVK